MFSSTIKRSVATLGVVAGLLAAAVPASAVTAPVSNAPSPYVPGQGSASDPTAQGLIMSDGRICNPRWGC